MSHFRTELLRGGPVCFARPQACHFFPESDFLRVFNGNATVARCLNSAQNRSIFEAAKRSCEAAATRTRPAAARASRSTSQDIQEPSCRRRGEAASDGRVPWRHFCLFRTEMLACQKCGPVCWGTPQVSHFFPESDLLRVFNGNANSEI